MLLQTFMKKRQYTYVDSAENGQLAAQAAENQAYDIIFMDISMPVMNGFEATRRIRESEGRRRAAAQQAALQRAGEKRISPAVATLAADLAKKGEGVSEATPSPPAASSSPSAANTAAPAAPAAFPSARSSTDSPAKPAGNKTHTHPPPLVHEAEVKPALIIALTGLASSRDQGEAFSSGVDLFMTKPVSFREVGRLLDNWESNGGRAG
jgi:CheY-like chemotaxis protein